MIQSSVQLVSYLSPHIKLPGYTPFVMAIDLASELLGEKLPDQIHFTQDVYIKISEKTGHSLPAVQRAIYRAVDACWMDGKNPHLDEIIGVSVPSKPAPREMILYCAYYLKFHSPYHSQSAPQVSLAF